MFFERLSISRNNLLHIFCFLTPAVLAVDAPEEEEGLLIIEIGFDKELLLWSSMSPLVSAY